jgi:hypothetical protein
MKSKLLLGVVVLACGSTLCPPAHAGIYADDLSKCLVKNTSSADKSALVQWMFFAMALNHNVASLTAIPEAKRVETDENTAALFERLLTDSCAAETQDAVKYEGSGAISESFKLLGEVATQEMLTDPAVAKGISNFAQYLDKDRINKIFGKSSE